jgi:DNA polymerase elongation subunit (family B)
MSSFYTSVYRVGNSILLRGYKNGTAITKRTSFSPEFFVPDSTGTGGWTSMFGHPLKQIKFDDINSAKAFVDKHRDVENFKFFGSTNYVQQFIAKEYPGKIDFQLNDINVANFDIETESELGFPYPDKAEYPILSIAYKSSKSHVYRIWGMGNYDPSKETNLPEGCFVQYTKCATEEDLLLSFLEHWSTSYPDIITGWNIRTFDIPYIVNRISRVLGEDKVKLLSPWNRVSFREINIKNKKTTTFEIMGISQLDYMDLFQKFGFTYGPQESYSLDNIANVVLGERKLSYSEYGSLHLLYKHDYQKFISYNLRDVILVDKIDKKTMLIELTLLMAYQAGINPADALGTTLMWESIIYRYCNEHKIAIPSSAKREEKDSLPGGYVSDPIIGMHEWVCSFDLNSLYPMTIVQYNMSPETLIRDVKGIRDVDHYLAGNRPRQDLLDKNYAVAANGAAFSKEKEGILPQLVNKFYADRKTTKKEMLRVRQEYEIKKDPALETLANKLDNTQHALKICLNSLYGALGNVHFAYFLFDIAEAITMSGQLAVRSMENGMNKYLNKLLKTEDIIYSIAGDTDSSYLCLNELIKRFKPADPVKFLDEICKAKLEPQIAKIYKDLYVQMNAYRNMNEAKRDVIADKAIWVAKKRYIMNVHNAEGVQYAEPKMKIMGIEAVKSSTPKVVRDKFKQAYKIMLEKTEEDLQEFVLEFEKLFKTLPADEVSFPRGVSDIEKYQSGSTYSSGCPIHVRGSIVHNQLLKKHNLPIQEIKNGTKVRFCYLKLPNPARENVIAFENFLPKEFGLEEYVDYDTQFEKTFKAALKHVSDAINWRLEYTPTLERFFG